MKFSAGASTTVDYGIALDTSNQGRFIIRNKDYSTSSNFKSWLSSHNTTVYYPVEYTTDTLITDTTLLDDLNKIAQAMGADEKTNIEVTASTSGDLLPQLNVTAYQKNFNGLTAMCNDNFHLTDELSFTLSDGSIINKNVLIG